MLYRKQYDFLWSTGTIETLSSVEAGISFITNSISAVKPGGKVVHVLSLIVDRDFHENQNDDSMPMLWRADDIKKIRNSLCEAGFHSIP